MVIYYLYVKTHKITGLKYLGYTKRQDPYSYTGSGKEWTIHLELNGYYYDTQILKICYSKKSVREWGLFYSVLWRIVESKKWANLRVEDGEGGDTVTGTTAWNNGKKNCYSKTCPGTDWVIGLLPQKAQWFNNGVIESKFEECPVGWDKGRLTGKKAWNNGVSTVRSFSCPGPEWVQGRLVTKGMQESSKKQKGYCTVRDLDGNKIRVQSGDVRLSTGELVHHNKNKVPVLDPQTGKLIQVSKDEDRYVNKEVIPVHTNKVTLYDADGNKVRTTKNDIRLVDGSLSGNKSKKTDNFIKYKNKRNP